MSVRVLPSVRVAIQRMRALAGAATAAQIGGDTTALSGAQLQDLQRLRASADALHSQDRAKWSALYDRTASEDF